MASSVVSASGSPYPPASPAPRASRDATVAASIGNILEWYDFGIYGLLAGIIGAKFFAAGDPVSALLSSLAVFGIGFVARPLGGIVIGYVADIKGRRPALMLTIMIMAIGTLLIGIAPTYATAGIAAPTILVVARLLQGFSTGGEWGTSAAFVVEWAPKDRRGLYGSMQQMTAYLGLLLGSTVAAVLSTVLTTAQMEDWGWRVPFLLGALIGPIGLYMRRTISETPAFQAASEAPPVARQTQWGPSVRLFCIAALSTSATFTFMYYLPTFTQRFGGVSRAESLWSNSLALVVLAAAIPLGGLLSDRIGRKPLMVVASLLFLCLSYPLISATIAYPGFQTVLLVQICLNLFFALYCGPLAAASVELFPTENRLRWLSSAYNASNVAFGAFAAYIAAWLVQATGSPVSVVYFVIATAVIAVLGLFGMRETAHEPLR